MNSECIDRNKKIYEISESGGEALEIWCEIDEIRDQISLGGKDLIANLICINIRHEPKNENAIIDVMSKLMGRDVYLLILKVLQEFEGRDPGKHLWAQDDVGVYHLHR